MSNSALSSPIPTGNLVSRSLESLFWDLSSQPQKTETILKELSSTARPTWEYLTFQKSQKMTEKVFKYCWTFTFPQVSLKEKLNLILWARPFVRFKGPKVETLYFSFSAFSVGSRTKVIYDLLSLLKNRDKNVWCCKFLINAERSEAVILRPCFAARIRCQVE